eukprot:TRINITY_DN10695_c0_g1_i1.p1 TRINITY_DN10695_c0_g1~~TRINITY_DN10695_c0_g1_i1.p1  ORF type:complete len:233 (+),score=44.53 TRINITY_DN10695_c0_g1_i1:161-859(+)
MEVFLPYPIIDYIFQSIHHDGVLLPDEQMDGLPCQDEQQQVADVPSSSKSKGGRKEYYCGTPAPYIRPAPGDDLVRVAVAFINRNYDFNDADLVKFHIIDDGEHSYWMKNDCKIHVNVIRYRDFMEKFKAECGHERAAKLSPERLRGILLHGCGSRKKALLGAIAPIGIGNERAKIDGEKGKKRGPFIRGLVIIIISCHLQAQSDQARAGAPLPSNKVSSRDASLSHQQLES